MDRKAADTREVAGLLGGAAENIKMGGDVSGRLERLRNLMLRSLSNVV